MPSPALLTRRNCLAALAYAAVGLPAVARSAPARPAAPGVSAADLAGRWSSVRVVLDSFVREGRAPGVSFAAAYGGAPPAYLNAGTVAFDSRQPFDEHSLCRIYSMSKHVMRTASLLLVEDGAITLDQPVVTVLPEFAKLRVAIDVEKGLESRPATRVMTMRHLLTNSSGLGNWTPGSDSGEALHRLYRERGITPGNFGAGRRRPEYGTPPASLDEFVARVAELPLAYEPGTVLHYSIGFDVMAAVIERVVRQRYDAFVHERLFAPLDMASTGFEVRPADAGRLTTNYDATERGVNSVPDGAPHPELPPGFRVQDERTTSEWLRPPALIAGGAGVVSTSRDFLRYAQMLLGGGALDGTRVLKPATAELVLGNIDPPGVAEPTGDAGAGTRAMLRSLLIPPGTKGGGGSSGTLFWMDRARRGAAVFMSQVMYGSPARSPFQPALFPALERDLDAEPRR